MSKNLRLSAFFPAHNEEENIEKTIETATTVLRNLVGDYEIIVIDDGSADKTGEIVKGLAKNNSRIGLVSHKTNLGYGAALRSGFATAKFPLIVYTDSDGQFDFGEIEKFLAEIDQADLVIGYRKKRAEGAIRQLNATSWRFLNFLLFGLKVRDIDCGFKLIKNQVLKKIPKLESNGATISAELLVKAKIAGFKIAEVPVSHYPRKSGRPTGADLRVIFKALFELFRLYPKLNSLSRYDK